MIIMHNALLMIFRFIMKLPSAHSYLSFTHQFHLNLLCHHSFHQNNLSNFIETVIIIKNDFLRGQFCFGDIASWDCGDKDRESSGNISTTIGGNYFASWSSYYKKVYPGAGLEIYYFWHSGSNDNSWWLLILIIFFVLFPISH